MANISSDLTVGKISRLIKSIAIPAVIGTFFQTLYNIVDVKFAGMISPYALTGISKVFPVYFVIIALSAGLSIGTTSLVSNYLGTKNFDKASLLFSQSLIVAIFFATFVASFGIFIAPVILNLLNTDQYSLVFAIDYINVIFLGSIIFFLLVTSNAALTARGDTKSYRNVLIFGFFLNILLNPLFIFGFGPGYESAGGLEGGSTLNWFLNVLLDYGLIGLFFVLLAFYGGFHNILNNLFVIDG